MDMLFNLKGVKKMINTGLYIGGDMICSFVTEDNIQKCMSYMGNNLTPYSIAIGDENIYILTPHFRSIKRHRIDDNENFVDLFDHYDSNCGKHSFRKLRIYKIHSNFI